MTNASTAIGIFQLIIDNKAYDTFNYSLLKRNSKKGLSKEHAELFNDHIIALKFFMDFIKEYPEEYIEALDQIPELTPNIILKNNEIESLKYVLKQLFDICKILHNNGMNIHKLTSIIESID